MKQNNKIFVGFRHTDDDESEPDSPVNEAPPETEQIPTQSHTLPRKSNGPSWEDIILSSYSARQQQNHLPPLRRELQPPPSLDDPAEQDITYHHNTSGPSKKTTKPETTQAQLARLKSQLKVATNPFNPLSHGDFVTGMRELIHWQHGQLEKIPCDTRHGREREREVRYLGQLEAILKKALIRGERNGVDGEVDLLEPQPVERFGR